MSLFPGPQESCFYLDPNMGLTDNNKWFDSSPFSLHVDPIGYSSPAYGLSTGPSGAKAISFNGTTQRGELPLRFYDHAPASVYTFAVVARWNAPAANDRMFDTWSANTGLAFYNGSTERLSFYGGAGTTNVAFTANAPLTSRTRVAALGHDATAPSALGWIDRNGEPVTRTASAAIPYNTATVPTVGSAPGGGTYFDGDLYHLSIWPRVWSHAEAVAWSDYWMARI